MGSYKSMGSDGGKHQATPQDSLNDCTEPCPMCQFLLFPLACSDLNLSLLVFVSWGLGILFVWVFPRLDLVALANLSLPVSSALSPVFTSLLLSSLIFCSESHSCSSNSPRIKVQALSLKPMCLIVLCGKGDASSGSRSSVDPVRSNLISLKTFSSQRRGFRHFVKSVCSFLSSTSGYISRLPMLHFKPRLLSLHLLCSQVCTHFLSSCLDLLDMLCS